MWNIQLDAIVSDGEFRLFTLKNAGRRFSYEFHLSQSERIQIGSEVFIVESVIHNIDTGVGTAILGLEVDGEVTNPVDFNVFADAEDVLESLRMNGFQDVTEESTIDA